MQQSALLLLIMGVFCTPIEAAEIPEKRQQELRHLLVQDCGSCHGLTMKGGLGSPLVKERLADRPNWALAEIIRNGIPGTAMPPWKALLSDPEINWMVNELKQGEL